MPVSGYESKQPSLTPHPPSVQVTRRGLLRPAPSIHTRGTIRRGLSGLRDSSSNVSPPSPSSPPIMVQGIGMSVSSSERLPEIVQSGSTALSALSFTPIPPSSARSSRPASSANLSGQVGTNPQLPVTERATRPALLPPILFPPTPRISTLQEDPSRSEPAPARLVPIIPAARPDSTDMPDSQEFVASEHSRRNFLASIIMSNTEGGRMLRPLPPMLIPTNTIIDPPIPKPVEPLIPKPVNDIENLADVKNYLNGESRTIVDPDLLFKILKGPFEANWFKLKACLTMGKWPGSEPAPEHERSMILMHKMVAMRKLKWRAFTVLVLRKMKDEVKRIALMKGMESSKEALERESEQQNLAKTLDSVGAEAVTSDIDLSLAGTNTEIAVRLINTSFPAYFGVPYAPATVFDINVYASDWIHKLKDTEEYTDDRVAYPDGRNILTITPGVEHTRVSAPGLLKIDTEQEIWSMVKIRRNLNEDQWNAYKLGLSAELLPSQKILMGTKFSKVEFQYKRFTLDIHLRKKKLSEAFNLEENKIKGSKTIFDAKYSSDALETIASNDIYGDLLLNVKKLRLELQEPDMPDDPAHRIKMENKAVLLSSRIAEALTFANEVYSTEGAVKHTVLGQSAGKKQAELNESRASNPVSLVYNINPELYLQSVNENVGDALHSLHAYHHSPAYAVYRAGKYLARLAEAALKILAEDTVLNLIPGFIELNLIGTHSVALKAESVLIEGVVLEGDPKKVMDNTFFIGRGENIDALTATIISVGAAISGKFQRNKPVPVPVSTAPVIPAVRRSRPESPMR